MSNDHIKKAHFKYAECQAGNLHTGQVMNLVCVDSKCQHRGLVCPICRMQSHEGHYTLPIKSFLDQVQSLFMQSDNTEELNSLSDYLRSLETSRKQILAVIKQEVLSISNCFKELEQKIQEIYIGLRKSVLTQSSITTKLPSLLTLLMNQSSKDSFEMQKQFKKYCELLKYENQKIKVSDKAKKIVETYATIPNKIKVNIEKASTEYAKILKAATGMIDKNQIQSKINEVDSKVTTFSEKEKSLAIKLSDYFTVASMPMDQYFGLVFVNESFCNMTQSQLNVEVVRNESGSLTIGVGDTAEFSLNNYYENSPNDESVADFISCYGDNSAEELAEKNKPIPVAGSESDEQPEPILTQSKRCFQFFEPGTTIAIKYDNNTNQIQLRHKSTGQLFRMALGRKPQNSKNIKLFFSMGENDSIKIVNQQGKDKAW